MGIVLLPTVKRPVGRRFSNGVIVYWRQKIVSVKRAQTRLYMADEDMLIWGFKSVGYLDIVSVEKSIIMAYWGKYLDNLQREGKEPEHYLK